MKILLTILFLSLLSSPSWSETFDDLVQRDGVYYKKFSNVPFSGKITGLPKGSIKNGKFDGEWVGYWEDVQLMWKGNYKNGKREGAWAGYDSTGQLLYEGHYKNGKKEGDWDGYNKDGTVDKERTGTFKDGEKISD